MQLTYIIISYNDLKKKKISYELYSNSNKCKHVNNYILCVNLQISVWC